MLEFITKFGDSALLVPASLLLLFYLLCQTPRRAALVWLSTLMICVALTALLKVGFRSSGGHIGSVVIRTPSGHASLGMSFYVFSALLLAKDRELWTRILLLGGSVAFVLLIAFSRIVLHEHTAAEVLIGLLIGACCVAWFSTRTFDAPEDLHWPTMATGFFVIVLLLHSEHFDLELQFRQVAALLQSFWS